MSNQIRIKLKSYDHKLLDGSVKIIIDSVKAVGAVVKGPIPLITRIQKFTLNKSPHVHKKSREQWERRKSQRLLLIDSFNPRVVEVLQGVSLAAGVSVELDM